MSSWLRKASHDLAAARLLGATHPPILDVAAYHCQQAAEKALKAYLVFYDQRVAKIHDVGQLLDQVMTIEPVFETWRDAADRLTPLATLYRYPGSSDDLLPLEFEEALDDATTIVRQVLTLPPENVHPVAEDS
ncbi:MAG: HEPN domain-containing protein [Isosphaeraceae bacterium]